MRRREFLTLLGGAALGQGSRRTRKQRALPVIGYLSGRSHPMRDPFADPVGNFSNPTLTR